jgi:hypothetical protein
VDQIGECQAAQRQAADLQEGPSRAAELGADIEHVVVGRGTDQCISENRCV